MTRFTLAHLRPALHLALALLAARVVYLASLSPFGLVEDEAQYWEWSKHLDWSYHTKGPGIAWAIALSAAVFGDTTFAVRLVAAVASFVTTLAVAALVVACCGAGTGGAGAGGEGPGEGEGADSGVTPARAGLYAAAALQLAPFFQAAGLISTIDGPYCACWAVAVLAAWRALVRRGRWAWVGLGTALGVGFLFKYTIVLLVPGLLLFVWAQRRAGRGASEGAGEGTLALASDWRRWALAGAAVALLGCAPVLVWNQQQGWPTLNHLLGHLGFAEKGTKEGVQMAAQAAPPGGGTSAARPSLWWRVLWPLQLLGMQLAFAGPAIGLVVLWWWRRRTRAARVGERFLFAVAVPILVFYLGVSLVAEPEGNWPIAALVTLLPLAGWLAAGAMTEYRAKVAAWVALPAADRARAGFLRAKPETAGQVLWHAGVAVGVGLGLLTLGSAALRLAPQRLTSGPLARLNQGPTMAAAAARLLEALKARSSEPPFVVAQHYGRASQLAFELPGRPRVYCSNSRQGGRPTQHDYWPTHNLDDAGLLGRNALMVGGSLEEWSRVFDRVEPLGLLAGVERKGVHAWYGLGYRGFGRGRAR